MKAPLPQIDEVNFDREGTSAWKTLLEVECAAAAETKRTAKYNDKLIGVRVLGFFLKDFWELRGAYKFADTAYHRLAVKIVYYSANSTKDERDEKIYRLGIDYRRYVILSFRPKPEPTPIPSYKVTPPPFDVHKASILAAMNEATLTKSDIKEVALGRDSYKCVLAGHYDCDSCEKYPEVAEMMKRDIGAFVCTTEVAHLFSQTAQESDKQNHGAIALTFLEQFGLGDSVRNLLGGQVNSPRNVLTMDAELHALFDRFKFWLEEVPGQPHTYNVVAPPGSLVFERAIKPRRQITLSVPPELIADYEARGIPVPELPDRDLMAMKAACARVAHMSGAAEQIDQLDQDVEDIQVLAEDGSHAGCLASLLNYRLTLVRD